MRLVVEHSRRNIHRTADQILADDNDGKAGRTHVFLRAGIEKTELRNVNRLGQSAGADVRDQRNAAGIRKLMVLCSVNCIVQADMEIVRFRIKGGRIKLWYVRKRLSAEEATTFALPYRAASAYAFFAH